MNEKVVKVSKSDRDALRAALLGNQKPKSKIISLFGQEVELRQPNLKSILEARDMGDTVSRAVSMIIRYAYVPGTDELIFEETDQAVMLNWPFGDDLIELQDAINELAGININAVEAELNADPLEGS